MGEIDLPVVSNGFCQDKLRSTRLGQKFKLHDSFLCAGGIAGKDTCKGDGGSPLVCPSKYDPNTYIQAGIVAWGIGCGENGTPGVYADVSKATCWIDQVMTCHYGGLTGDQLIQWLHQQCVWNLVPKQNCRSHTEGSGWWQIWSDLQNMINEYSKCNVNWEQPTAPLVDISDFERANDNYSGAEEEVKAAPQVEQEQPY